MAYVLVARMRARDGEEQRAEELLRELAPASRSEPGCNEYIAHRSAEDPRAFMIYEQYRDEAAFEEHGQSEHFQRLGAGELFGLMEDRERLFYETLE